MSLQQGFNIVDSALNTAVDILEVRGMPRDDAHIALLIRLKALVPAEVLKVAELLSDDAALDAAINQQGKAQKIAPAE